MTPSSLSLVGELAAAPPIGCRQPERDILYVYLSGSIRKGSTDSRPAGTFWSDLEEQLIVEGITVADEVRTLNAAKSQLRRTTTTRTSDATSIW